MRVKFSGYVDIPIEEGLDLGPLSGTRSQLIRDCTISTLWSHLNDGPLTEPIIERLNLKIEVVQVLEK